jgi:hypothetical protein
MNPFHILNPYLFVIHFNIIIQSAHVSKAVSSIHISWLQFCIHFLSLRCVFHSLPRPSFDHHNSLNMWYVIFFQIMDLLMVYFLQYPVAAVLFDITMSVTILKSGTFHLNMMYLSISDYTKETHYLLTYNWQPKILARARCTRLPTARHTCSIQQ